MKISPVAANNADLSTALQEFMKSAREQSAQQTQSQQAALETKPTAEKIASQASVQISAQGQEAYAKSRQVTSAEESGTESNKQSKERDMATRAFDEGVVKQLAPTVMKPGSDEEKVANSNAESNASSGNAAALQNFAIPGIDGAA